MTIRYSSSFHLYINREKKQTFYDFVKKAVRFHVSTYMVYPNKAVINPVDLPSLGNAKGLIFEKIKIPLETARNCLPGHIELH